MEEANILRRRLSFNENCQRGLLSWTWTCIQVSWVPRAVQIRAETSHRISYAPLVFVGCPFDTVFLILPDDKCENELGYEQNWLYWKVKTKIKRYSLPKAFSIQIQRQNWKISPTKLWINDGIRKQYPQRNGDVWKVTPQTSDIAADCQKYAGMLFLWN